MPLQRHARTTSTSPLAIQRVWDFNKPNWASTQSIGTISSAQPVVFFRDNTGDTMVVKKEDTAISLAQITGAAHRSVHGVKVVRLVDMSAHKSTIVNKLGDPSLTDASWQRLYNAFKDNFDKDEDYADLKTGKEKAVRLHQDTFRKGATLQGMELAQGKQGEDISNPANVPQGYQSMRRLLMNEAYVQQMGEVTAVDLFTENMDRFGANINNWMTGANNAITLIDNVDAGVRSLWTRSDDGVLGPSHAGSGLYKLRTDQLQQTANTLVANMASAMERAGDATASAWLKEAYQNGTRQQFIAAHFLAGLTKGRARIIALYAAKKDIFGKTKQGAEERQTRGYMKEGAKRLTKADRAGKQINKKVDYWERIKARARWLKAN